MLLDDYEWSDKKFAWTFEPKGGSPVVISVPHDRGFHPSDLLGIFEEREGGVKGRDSYSWSIIRDILPMTKVNAVRALFPRHFIDYNRPSEAVDFYMPFQKEEEMAFDDVRLEYIYNHYHQTIARLLKRAIQVYGQDKCLLIDFHGFIKQPSYGEYDLILGTGNRTTVNSDVDKALAGFLSAQGYKVFLPAEKTVAQGEDLYDAHFITRYYAKTFGVDAIQIETAKKFRVFEGGEIGKKLSADLAEFFRLYLNTF